jgi:phosphoribosylformylglycinamidine synthase
MRFAVIQFPGSNCDQDVLQALRTFDGASADYVWHKTTSLAGYDAVVVPGGFSYGDYLRCGAIARFSPIMGAVKEFAGNGGNVLGICNGFQILCESGLLPGALVRNRDLHFICEHVKLRVESASTRFTTATAVGAILNIPIAHGEGCYFADPATLSDLRDHDQILLRYCDPNPNGSCDDIAGIRNRDGNVFGLMPHPERACDPLLGSADGRVIFESLISASPRPRVSASN